MASDTASDGTCRAPPVSEAISFNPTAVIHGPPNDRPSRISETLATTQEVRVSIERASVLCVVTPVPGGSAWKCRRKAGRMA